jgi:hypothetical protein
MPAGIVAAASAPPASPASSWTRSPGRRPARWRWPITIPVLWVCGIARGHRRTATTATVPPNRGMILRSASMPTRWTRWSARTGGPERPVVRAGSRAGTPRSTVLAMALCYQGAGRGNRLSGGGFLGLLSHQVGLRVLPHRRPRPESTPRRIHVGRLVPSLESPRKPCGGHPFHASPRSAQGHEALLGPDR